MLHMPFMNESLQFHLPTRPPNFHFHFPKSKIYLPWAIGRGFFLEMEYLVLSDKQKNSPKKQRAIIKKDTMPGPCIVIVANVKQEGVQCTIISPLAHHSRV